ncbi:MAG: DUF456 domain-containing protein [Bacteroidales bacterium]|nr:DUF456 domain-containing protein [Bacteroidales bacterium]
MEIFIEILLYIAVSIFIIVGFIGCVVPVIPGPVIAYGGMLIGHFFIDAIHFETQQLWIAGVICVGVQVLDQIVPVIGTKKFGGSKYGTWGSIIGLLAGLFVLPALGPFGIITILGGPFLGAYIGEKIGGQDDKKALRAAFGSFLGFVAGTLLKLFVTGGITAFILIDIFRK